MAVLISKNGEPVVTQAQEARVWQEKFLGEFSDRGDIVTPEVAAQDLTATQTATQSTIMDHLAAVRVLLVLSDVAKPSGPIKSPPK